MSMLRHLSKEQQQIEPLFGGAFIENKPIPFPSLRSTQAYSNLFYWAHLEAFETGEFPLHPHEGFEIMTFVFKGSLEHFDTATNIWTPLVAGGVQVIQAGSGVQHAERIVKGSELFQIWFDPDFSKTLLKEAAYKDYTAGAFSTELTEGVRRLVYLEKKGPVYFETPGIEIEKLSFNRGEFIEKLDKDFTYSYYLLKGEMKMDEVLVHKDDFVLLTKADEVSFSVQEKAELFVIKSPSKIGYGRFIERYGA